jgi:transposase-like protein
MTHRVNKFVVSDCAATGGVDYTLVVFRITDLSVRSNLGFLPDDFVLLQTELEERHGRVIYYSAGVPPVRKRRKNYSPSEKVAILRRHLIDKVPISDLCDELQLQPTQLYSWQKQFFENGAVAFERKASHSESAHVRTIALLREKIQRKNEVVAELMEEHVQLKKGLGDL